MKLVTVATTFIVSIVLVGASSYAQVQIKPASGFESRFRFQIPTEFVPATDLGFVYTEFVNAKFDSTGVDFDRKIISWFGALHSPGTRVNFRTDAKLIDLRLSYSATFATAGAGLFRLEIDGVLQSDSFGSDTDKGVQNYALVDNPKPELHAYSLIMPYGSDVTFSGLQLTGGSASLVGTPPARPSFHYVAFGDSITQGYDSSSVASSYPYKIGAMRNWSVTNLGYRGRRVVASDGLAVAALNADCISLAIGVNNGIEGMPTPLAAFEAEYKGLLDNVRSVQPTVPLLAITPTWIAAETTPNLIGLVMENYRQVIRAVVTQRMLTDPQLFLVEGLSLVPGEAANFPGGIHPSDAGFTFYANNLNKAFSNVFGAPNSEPNAISAGENFRGSHDAFGVNGGSYSQSVGSLLSPGIEKTRFDSLEADRFAASFELGLGENVGTDGAPRLTLSGAPHIGAELVLLIGNSSGAATTGCLLFAAGPMSRMGWESSLVLFGNRTDLFAIPREGLRLPFTITQDHWAGESLQIQLVQFDAAASSGLSISRPCLLRFERTEHTVSGSIRRRLEPGSKGRRIEPDTVCVAPLSASHRSGRTRPR